MHAIHASFFLPLQFINALCSAVKDTLKSDAHLIAGIVATLTIANFFTSPVLIELFGSREEISDAEIHEFDDFGHFVQEEMGEELCPRYSHLIELKVTMAMVK